MSLEALPFVNWIFWATLTSGTLLVVGGTEMLGGTTRGYRLFMAGVLAVCAAILLLSELNLAQGTVAEVNGALRQALAGGAAQGRCRVRFQAASGTLSVAAACDGGAEWQMKRRLP